MIKIEEARQHLAGMSKRPWTPRTSEDIDGGCVLRYRKIMGAHLTYNFPLGTEEGDLAEADLNGICYFINHAEEMLDELEALRANVGGTAMKETSFDLGAAKNLRDRLMPQLGRFGALPKDFFELFGAIWGYPAALDEIRNLRAQFEALRADRQAGEVVEGIDRETFKEMWQFLIEIMAIGQYYLDLVNSGLPGHRAFDVQPLDEINRYYRMAEEQLAEKWPGVFHDP